MSACTLVGVRSQTEEPRFETVQILSEGVEIRAYAPRVAAQVALPVAPGMMDRNQAFRLLFRYISGANRASQSVAMTTPVESPAGPAQGGGARKIAMTVPVQMGAEEGADHDDSVMRFFLPASYSLETAPVPTDSRVSLVEVPAQTMAVVRFAGLRDDRETARREAALLRRLENSDWVVSGRPVAYAYDPPWTLPPFRRNEVAVPVVRRAPTEEQR